MKKAFSFLLVFVMLLGIMPITAFTSEAIEVTEATEIAETMEATEETELPDAPETTVESAPDIVHEHKYEAVVTAHTSTEQGYTTDTCEYSDSNVDDYAGATINYELLEVLMERGAVTSTYDLSYTSDLYRKCVRSAYDIKTGGATRMSIEAFDVAHGTIYIQFFTSDYTKISSVSYTVETVVSIPDNCDFIRIEIHTSQNLERIALRFYDGTNAPREAKRFGINEVSEKLTYKVSEDVHTTSRLMLPPNYSTDGEKVPLILWLEGSGSGLSSWNGDFNSNKLSYLRYLRDEGFAVFSVYAWGNQYAEKYPGCGKSFPYPIPVNLACIREGIEYICDRYNIDPDDIHIMSKSQGGQCALYYASCNELNVKTIGMFAPVLDYLSMPGEAMYKDTRAAIADELDFTGDVEYFASNRFLSYSEEGRAFLRQNLDKLMIFNEAWTNLSGATPEELFEASMDDCKTFWTEQIWKTNRTDIYTHTEYVKTASVPVKIWGARDDAATPYLKMVEVVQQLKNGGSVADLRTMTPGTGAHSCADTGSTRVDVTTALGIEHKNVPVGWVENIQWIRSNGSVEETHTHYYEVTVTPPTSTEKGYTTYTCLCGHSYVADYVDAIGSFVQLDALMERGAVSSIYDLGYSSDQYNDYIRTAYDVKTGGAARISIKKFNANHGTIYIQFFASDYKKISSVSYTQQAVVNIPEGCDFVRVEIRTKENIEKIGLRFYEGTDAPREVKRAGKNTVSEKLTYKVSDDVHTTSRLMLPPNYSIDGEKVPLILWLDGSGSGLSSWDGNFNQEKLPYLKYLRDEGFAVFSVYAWGNQYAEKYPGCGQSFPYPVPTNLACIKAGIKYICDRYNIDADNIHIMSKSQGGQCALYYASCNELNVKTIGMFAPVLDYLSMPGEARYKDTRAAIAEDLGFTGDVEYFSSDRFLSYSDEGRAFLRENLDKLLILNEAWTNLSGATPEELFESAMDDCETFWTEEIWKTNRTDIYTHTEYVKTASVPVKIWGASDDAATPYLKMVEVVQQFKNGGAVADLRILPRGTGAHNCADTGSTRVDVTTALGIEYKNIPIGWVENIQWIRSNVDAHTHAYTATFTAPTCTEKGYTTYTCACGDSYVGNYVDAAGHTYENGVCTGCGAVNPDAVEPMALWYDDHVDMTGKVVEILDAGKPTSYQVGYGVEENKVLDTTVVTPEGNTLVATGIGTAMVRIDGQVYEVNVTAAPISLLLIIGQSNAEGMEGNANQSVVCEDGQVYSTYAKSNGLTGDAGLTVENAGNYVPSALTGAYANVNVNGTDTKLSDYPVYSLANAGAGKYGMDSGLAYEWVQQTGEKVWVVNAAHGGTSINTWQKGADNYDQAVALFRACQQVLQAEIAAGHYTFSHMGYYWNQGCADEAKTAEWYVGQYLAMHENLKMDLACDMDGNAATADNVLEFGNILLVQAGHSNATGYRQGVYEDDSDSFFMTYKELELRGPRVAQIWMANNPELTDIHIVSTLAQNWVTMPDGSDGVAEYFQTAYPDGTVDYTTQVKQSASWYTPTTPAAVKDTIHYNQIGYNEIGREAARNTLYILGILEKPQKETTIQFLNWTGYENADTIKTSGVATSDTLVVPLVYPCYESKTVQYTLSDGLTWSYYDLLDTGVEGGMLTSSVGDQTVNVTAREFASYRFELVDGKLVCVSDDTFRENQLAATTAGTYTLTEPIVLMHNREWTVEFNSVASNRFMALASSKSTVEGMLYFFKSNSGTGVLAVGEYKEGLYQNYGLLQSQIQVDWKAPHVYRFENKINADGSNVIHIFVDNEWVGTATNLIINSQLQNTDNMYLSGKDLVFTSIGCSTMGLGNGQMTYLEVREEKHNHTYENGICAGCGAAAPSSYAGKTIACIGDSITYGVGVTRDQTDYVTLLAKSLEMDYIRLGASGTTLCTDGHATCNIRKLTEANLAGADVVTILMGINDFVQAKNGYYSLGTIDSTDTSTIYGAVHMWCQRIEELRQTDSLRDTEFYFMTPVITSWNNSVSSVRNWDQAKMNIHSYRLRDLCNAIIEVCALYDIPVIDLNLISGLYYNSTEDNNIDIFGGDGAHPGAAGHQMMASAIENVLLQNHLRDDHDHCYGSWITTTYPDCVNGEQHRVCTICTATESKQLDGMGHTYENGICTSCGVIQTSTFQILDVRCNSMETFTYEDGMSWSDWLNSKYNTGMGSCIAIWVSDGPDILDINPCMDIFVNGNRADYDDLIREQDTIELIKYQ